MKTLIVVKQLFCEISFWGVNPKRFAAPVWNSICATSLIPRNRDAFCVIRINLQLGYWNNCFWNALAETAYRGRREKVRGMVRNNVILPGQQWKEGLLENFVGVGHSDVHTPLKMFALIVHVRECKTIRLFITSGEDLCPECVNKSFYFLFLLIQGKGRLKCHLSCIHTHRKALWEI